jgi:hypothetical protein
MPVPQKCVKEFHMHPVTEAREQLQHRRYVEVLADEARCSIEDAESVYRDLMIELEASAKIPNFVPIFAWRRARVLLRTR